MTTLTASYHRQAIRRIAPKHIHWQPEHNLIAAILQQAIWDRTQRTWYTTRRWIAAMSEDPFGFSWCCRQIDQDPEVVKLAILNRWAAGEGPRTRIQYRRDPKPPSEPAPYPAPSL